MTVEKGAETDSLITFTADSETVHVRDELEGQGFDLHVTSSDDLDVQPALTDLFIFPVDDAISVTVSELRVYVSAGTSVWDESGDHLGEFTAERREFSSGTYFVQLTGPVTCYLRISETSFSGALEHERSQSVPLTLTFPEPTRLSIGARSHHTRPQATITVPDEPSAIREALPYLCSSIKEFSSERSWPTLRGHPPTIDVGDRLEIPDELSKPETGVTIVVPDTYADLYRVAPLAFYLGADLEAGKQPELRLENGYVEPLRTPSRSLEGRVDELLGTCLTLDSLVRMDGYFSASLCEYEQLAPHLPFYPPNLYGESLPDQLIEYLDVPFRHLEPYIPEWPMTAIVRPRPDDVEILPYILDSLSRVHVADDESWSCTEEVSATTTETIPESATSDTGALSSQLSCYTDSRPPAGAGWLVPAAFEAGITHSLSDAATAQFAYVTRHRDRVHRAIEAFAGEAESGDGTGTETRLETDTVSILERPTRDDLHRILQTEHDFLYCDLPTSTVSDDPAFECEDGPLEVDDVERVGAKTFVVRGAGSLSIGRELARSGAFAGAALETGVSPTDAARLMEFLLRGHLLVESLRFAGIDETTDWRFVGDPSRPTVRRDGGANPLRIDIESVDEDEHALSLWFQPTDILGLGSVGMFDEPYTHDAYQLSGSTVKQPSTISTSVVVSLLENTDHVVRLNGEVYGGESDVETFARASVRRTLAESNQSEKGKREDHNT